MFRHNKWINRTKINLFFWYKKMLPQFKFSKYIFNDTQRCYKGTTQSQWDREGVIWKKNQSLKKLFKSQLIQQNANLSCVQGWLITKTGPHLTDIYIGGWVNPAAFWPAEITITFDAFKRRAARISVFTGVTSFSSGNTNRELSFFQRKTMTKQKSKCTFIQCVQEGINILHQPFMQARIFWPLYRMRWHNLRPCEGLSEEGQTWHELNGVSDLHK